MTNFRVPGRDWQKAWLVLCARRKTAVTKARVECEPSRSPALPVRECTLIICTEWTRRRAQPWPTPGRIVCAGSSTTMQAGREGRCGQAVHYRTPLRKNAKNRTVFVARQFFHFLFQPLHERESGWELLMCNHEQCASRYALWLPHWVSERRVCDFFSAAANEESPAKPRHESVDRGVCTCCDSVFKCRRLCREAIKVSAPFLLKCPNVAASATDSRCLPEQKKGCHAPFTEIPAVQYFVRRAIKFERFLRQQQNAKKYAKPTQVNKFDVPRPLQGASSVI